MAKTLLVVILASIISGGLSQTFSFPSSIQYQASCDVTNSRWTVDGEVTLTQGDLSTYQSKVYVQTISKTSFTLQCEIDLTDCPKSASNTGTDVGSDVDRPCYCKSQTDGVFSFHIDRQATSSLGGHMVQAALRSRDIFNPVTVTSNVGILETLQNINSNCSHNEPTAPAATTTQVTGSTVEGTTMSPSSTSLGRYMPSEPPDITNKTCAKTDNSSSRQLAQLSNGVQVLCDTDTDGGRWIVIQRRTSADLDFYLPWVNYTRGFGDLGGDFWLGLETVHQICTNMSCQLRFDMQYNGSSYFAVYENFSISNRTDQYRLHIDGYRGTAGDSGHAFSWNNGMQFSTRDRDNAMSTVVHCAQAYRGAWWYNSCTYANMNGEWGRDDYKGVFWNPLTFDWITGRHSVSRSEMKVRRYMSTTK